VLSQLVRAELDPEPDPRAPRRRFVSVRAVVLGLLLAALVGLTEPYLTVYLSSSYMFNDYHSGGASFLVFVVFVLFNLLLGRVWGRLKLSAHELTVVAALLFVAGSCVTSGGVTHMVPLLSAAYYYATPANQWHTRLVPHMREWLSPLDSGGGTVAIRKFWEGVQSAEPIPWGPWIKPLLLWGLFLMAMFALLAAIMVLMRRQWMDHEHLSYPIAQVPAELCRACADPTGEGSIFRNKAFWIGLGSTFVLSSMIGVAYYAFDARWQLRISEKVTLAEGYVLRFWLELVVIGFVFLIPNRIAFSVWTLALVSWLLKAVIKQRGLGMQQYMASGGPPEMQYMVMGGLLVFVAASIWYGRSHLWKALRCALGTGDLDYDRNEAVSYRATFVVMLLSASVLLVWLSFSGMKFWLALAFLAVFITVYYAMARIIAQVGLPSASAPAGPAPVLGNLLGAANLGKGQVMALGYQFWNADLRQTPVAGTAHGLYLVRRRGGLYLAMLAALLVAYVAATYCVVRTGYRHGAANLNAWYIVNSAKVPWWWSTGMLSHNQGFSFAAVGWAGAGAIGMSLLTIAQRTFFWWPLHPIAFLVCHTHMVYNFWFSIFLAWMIKAFVVRFGGHAAYRIARRLFIGMLLGRFLAGGFWAIIDMLLRAEGNRVFAI
jgi:hypothetical protein